MSELTYTCVESFSGAGGLGIGLQRAGFRILSAFDNDERSIESFNAFHEGEVARLADAREVTGAMVREWAGLEEGEEVDLFSGGPPCQGFSKQKRGAHLGDERNDLVLEFARIVHELKPRFFLLENVASFGQKRGKRFIQYINELLSDEYAITPHTYNCADYGLAQTRRRFIIVGRRLSVATDFSIPHPTVTKWRTVGDVLDGIPEPPLDYKVHPGYPNHQAARVTDINIQRFSHVPQGGGWQDIPFDLRLPCHQKADTTSGGWPDVYGRLEWDGQAPTITGGFDSFTRGRYGHPLRDRPLTPHEASRLQGFPPSFDFKGTRQDVRRQIGNAVPPPLAEAIGLEIRRALLRADGFLNADEPLGATGDGQVGQLAFDLSVPKRRLQEPEQARL